MVAFRLGGWSLIVRALIIGMLFAIVFSIKPPLAMVMPVVLIGMLLQEGNLQRSETNKLWWLPLLFTAAAGFMLVIGLFFLYLALTDALNPFLDIVKHYWPLYSQLNGIAKIQPFSAGPLGQLDFGLLFGSFTRYLFLALVPVGVIFSLLWAWSDSGKRVEVVVLLLMACCFLVYVWIGNKFWLYHDFPFFWILSMFAGFSMWIPTRYLKLGATQLIVVVMVIVVTLYWLPWNALYRQYQWFFQGIEIPVKSGNVDQITSFLDGRLQPEDTILPLDVTGGAIHAMYRAQARIGSSFIYDFHFYHHCEETFIQALRGKMIQEIDTNRPRYVIKFNNAWRTTNNGECQHFPALENILEEQYVPVLDSKDYVILERTPG
jgi:hypothetical protein